MAEKRRDYKRVTCFEMIYSDIEDQEYPVGFLLNISESGAHVWLDSSKLEVADFKILKLKMPDEFNTEEILEISVRNVWYANAEEENFKKIGCQFIKMDEKQRNTLIKLINFFEVND